jgi:hypothetical protein
MLARPEWFADPEIIGRTRLTQAGWLARLLSRGGLRGKEAHAITLGHTVHFCEVDKYEPHLSGGLALLAHEVKHVEQYEREGWLKFYVKYLWDYVRGGYKNVRFEKEAIKFQGAVKGHIEAEFGANPGLSPCQEQTDPHTPNDAFVQTTPPPFVP